MLTLNNVNKTYYSLNGDSCRALIDINIKFNKTGLVFITGKSGSGKSTLLNVLGGLDKIDNGTIKVKDKSNKNFTSEDFDSYRNTYLGFVFQDFGILENLTVEENIALSLQLQGYKKPEINERVKKILGQVGLTGFGKRASNELSGGQLQRVSIARALVKEPEIILADEPTGNLDSETGIQIMNTLKDLSKTRLVIVVSHDIEFANKYADRIITLKDGSILEDYNVKRKSIQRKIKQKIVTNNQDLFENIETEKINLIKTKLPFKYVFKSAVSSIFRKKIKLILTLFLFVTSLFTLSISTLLSDYDISKSTINTMDYNNVDNLLVRKCYDFKIDYTKVFDINQCLFKSISNDETEDIISLSNDHDAISYRLINQGYPIPVIDSLYIDTLNLYSPMKIYGFMELPKDSIFEIIEGYYPTKENEIMLTDYLVEPISELFEINKDNILGSKLRIGNSEFIVTGIIDTDHEKYEYLKSVDYSSLDEEGRKKLGIELKKFVLKQERLYSRIILPENKEKADFNYVDNVKYRSNDDKFLGYINFSNNNSLTNEEIVRTYPENLEPLVDNEIYIDLYLFVTRLLRFDNPSENEYLAIEEVLNDLSIMDKYIGNTYTINYEYKDVMYSNELKIKGFYIPTDQTKSLKEGIISNIDIPNKLLSTTYDGYYLKLSDSKTQNVKLFKALNDNGYVQISSYSDHLYLVHGITEDLHKTLFYITIGLAIFSCVLIFVSITNSINEKQKDIGILRSIGTSGSDVGYIFLTESFILSIMSTIIAITIAYLVTQFINFTLMNYYGNDILFFDFGIRQVVYITLFSFIMTMISTVVPISRLVRMRPIEVVRKK